MLGNQELHRRFKMAPTLPQGNTGTLALLYRTLAQVLDTLPDGREKAKALNDLERSMMWARQSLEHPGTKAKPSLWEILVDQWEERGAAA
jgi:hypothetical protein